MCLFDRTDDQTDIAVFLKFMNVLLGLRDLCGPSRDREQARDNLRAAVCGHLFGQIANLQFPLLWPLLTENVMITQQVSHS